MPTSSRVLSIALFLSSFSACSWLPAAKSLAETQSGYTYVPLDPFPVHVWRSCQPSAKPDIETTLLDLLPDNAVRMSIEQFDANGKVSYGPVSVASQSSTYRVTVDYINSDTVNKSIWIAKRAQNYTTKNFEYVDLIGALPNGFVIGSEQYDVRAVDPYKGKADSAAQTYVEYNIPVYVGIGLRVTANVVVLGGKANIADLGAIGTEADANNLRGSLVVQTLGVNGKSIAAALPIQSELNKTTAQAAVASVGAIKALLREKDTAVSLRVVGLYLPFPGGAPLVNGIIGALSRDPVPWGVPCGFSVPGL